MELKLDCFNLLAEGMLVSLTKWVLKVSKQWVTQDTAAEEFAAFNAKQLLPLNWLIKSSWIFDSYLASTKSPVCRAFGTY